MDVDFLDFFSEKSYSENEEDIDSSEKCVIFVDLEAKEYSFEGKKIYIKSPFTISGPKIGGASIKCLNMIIEADGSLENVDISGSIIIKKSNFSIKNCKIHDGDKSVGGNLVIRESSGNLENVEITVGNSPGAFLEHCSDIFINNCLFHDINHTLIAVSISTHVIIQNSTFHNSPHNGVHASQSQMKIKNSKIYKTIFPAISATATAILISKVEIYEIEQNGISIDKSDDCLIKNCFLHQIGATAISANHESKATFRNNKFEEIGGNGFHITEKSNVEISQNVMNNCSFPAFAILNQCFGHIHHNIVTKCELSGACIRNATDVLFNDNEFTSMMDCGISISDTKKIQITRNSITNCQVAGIEAYNSSHVIADSNQISDIGEDAFLVYTGASIEARDNIITNVKRSFAALKWNGSGDFRHNQINNCPKLIGDDTNGDYVCIDNSGFENMTNCPEKSSEGINLLPKLASSLNDKCIKCNVNPRECFFQPCGHKVYCMKCGKEALESKDRCPLCRFPIEKVLEGYKDDDSSVCIICNDNKVDSIVMPCGHMMFCSACLSKWFLLKNVCPYCRCEHSFYKIISHCE